MATPELPTNVYRVDPANGELAVVAGDVNRPNGLALFARRIEALRGRGGRDRRASSTPTTWWTATRLAGKRRRSSTPAPARPTACACDVDGNLWVGWGMGEAGLDGVSVFNPEGKLIGRIDLPERCANLCFGGRYRNRLFMCGEHVVYSLYVNTQGAHGELRPRASPWIARPSSGPSRGSSCCRPPGWPSPPSAMARGTPTRASTPRSRRRWRRRPLSGWIAPDFPPGLVHDAGPSASTPWASSSRRRSSRGWATRPPRPPTR